MTAQFGSIGGSTLNSGVPTCRRKLGERVWQLLQFQSAQLPPVYAIASTITLLWDCHFEVL